MSFNYTIKTQKSVEQTVQDLTLSLSEIQFGVLGTLDFKNIFEKKGIEFENEYKLLEICNPIAAKHVLDSDLDLGLLLPCTIAVYRKNNETYISLAKPTALLSIISDTKLSELGREIETKLIGIIDKVK
ncbi:MAG: DUF302 domain-containing protein [Nitrosarchaeum sp.]|nr:DUF302 domain-containing protein [Nitrosarchaeum sp.]